MPGLKAVLFCVVLTAAALGQALPASAAGRAGPWCTGALDALERDGPDRATRVDILRGRLQPPEPAPKAAATPNRLVFVSAEAPPGGTGTQTAPYRGIQAAINRARPGDEIRVGPGRYSPVEIRLSGTAEAPITLKGLSDGTGARPVIDGTGLKVRGLIAIRGASHVTVTGFRLQNAPRDGVFVEGTAEGERNIRILDNDIHTTGNSAIFACGIVMRFLSGVDEYRLFDVLIEGNRITRTNEPKGVNEAISLGAGVDGFVIRNNEIFDTRQYGIDAKAGAINGVISDNLIYGIARHGIYLDTGSRRVANITVTRNAVFGAKNGIVLARESDRDPANPNLHGIRVTDNLVFDIDEFGILAYRHPDDSGIGRFDDVAIDRNCLCRIRRDAVRLGGIGGFARDISVRDNLVLQSGGTVWNRIGAREGENGPARGFACPS